MELTPHTLHRSSPNQSLSSSPLCNVSSSPSSLQLINSCIPCLKSTCHSSTNISDHRLMLANGSDGKSQDMASSRHSIFNVLDLVLNVTVSMLVLVSCPETKKLQDSVCYSYIQYITRSNLRSHIECNRQTLTAMLFSASVKPSWHIKFIFINHRQGLTTLCSKNK